MLQSEERMKTGFAVLVVCALLGCAMPSTLVRTPDTRPSITFIGAPPDSFVHVDGKNAGAASQYNGQPASGHPRLLIVEPGTHEVEIVDAAGQVIYHQKIFVESETKTIQVH